jgi:hypothetical protein
MSCTCCFSKRRARFYYCGEAACWVCRLVAALPAWCAPILYRVFGGDTKKEGGAMDDVELCDHCGSTLHDMEHDIHRDDTADHECVPMLRKEIERLRDEIALMHEGVAGVYLKGLMDGKAGMPPKEDDG